MTLLTYGEEITQRVLEKKYNQGQLTVQNNLQLLSKIVTPLENYQTYFQDRWNAAQDQLRYAFILERFHLTHVTYFEGLDWGDVEAIDNKLAKLNTKLCLLTLDRQVMADRIIQARGGKWRSYIARYGENSQQIIDHYYKRQQQKKRLAAKSNLSEFILDTTYRNEKRAAAEIINFWLPKT
jgi:hypothetical protein